MGQHESQETPGRRARHTRSARLQMIGAASVRLTRMPAPDAGRHLVPTYPPAPRLDLVEDLHGHPVADPYRWLEDPDSTETKDWSAAQDALLQDARGGWPGRDHLRGRLSELLSAGIVSAPVWRGERQFFMRRTASQEHAVLLTKDADGTERTLIDPIAIDPSGLTTLDSWQPDQGRPPPRLPAVRGRHRRVRGPRPGRRDRRARRWTDRPGALHPDRLAARRRVLLLRPTARTRAGAGRRGAVPPAGVAAPGRYVAGRRRPGLRGWPQGDRVLRRVREPRRPVAPGVRGGGHRSAQRPVGGAPAVRQPRGTPPGPGPGRRRRADRSGVLP